MCLKILSTYNAKYVFDTFIKQYILKCKRI